MCVLLKASLPLVNDNTVDTTQTHQQSSLQWFLQGKLFRTGEERNGEIMKDSGIGGKLKYWQRQKTKMSIITPASESSKTHLR